MSEYPMTFNEFVKRFITEEQCRDYLFKLRWPNGYKCPRCGGDDYRPLRYTLYDCKACKYQVSVIAGTIFQDTRTPLTTWFTAIWWVTTQKYGASAEGLQQVLGLGSYETAWTWLHKIRKAMVRPDRDKLSGIVEVPSRFKIMNHLHSSMCSLCYTLILQFIIPYISSVFSHFRCLYLRNMIVNRTKISAPMPTHAPGRPQPSVFTQK